MITFEARGADGIIAAMKLSSLGEFGLIELIKDAIQANRAPSSEASARILIDVGDDTAAWTGSDSVQLATTDSLVEGVHFKFDWCTWEDLGHKSLAVNLSDIAAMGGAPKFALVSLSCPSDVDSDSVMSYYHGMTQLARRHDTMIVGGNLTSSPVVTSTVSLIGEAPRERLMTRSSARPGQVVAVTGTLGGAAAALERLSRGEPSSAVPQSLLTALSRPPSRAAETRVLVEEGVRCAIDISDGLMSDLGHVCQCSHVSSVIEAGRLPLCVGYEGSYDDHVRLALSGGEDYELLFTCPPEVVARIASRLECPVTVVGRITATEVEPAIRVNRPDGTTLHTDRTGWGHFTL